MPDKQRRNDILFFVVVLACSILLDGYILWYLFKWLITAQLSGGEDY